MPELPEGKNPFCNAKIVGEGVDYEAYSRQEKGIVRGHPDFAMSRSELMHFASNPNRWIRGWEPRETMATEFGSLIDCLMTDRGRFDSKYAVHPATVSATKTMKAVKNGDAEEGDSVPWQPLCAEAKEWYQRHKGKTPLSPEDFQEAKQACARITEVPELAEFFDVSAKQVMVVAEYHDPETKMIVPWKCLIDLVPAKDHERLFCYLGDLKTCRSASLGKWQREVDDRNYDAQAAANLDCYVAATGEDRNTFVHVLLENVFPFEPSGMLLSQDLIAYGRAKVVGALRWYCQCLAEQTWPSWSGMYETMPKGSIWVYCQPGKYHSQLTT